MVTSIPALALAALRVECPRPYLLDMETIGSASEILSRGGGHGPVESLMVDAAGGNEEQGSECSVDSWYEHRVIA